MLHRRVLSWVAGRFEPRARSGRIPAQRTGHFGIADARSVKHDMPESRSRHSGRHVGTLALSSGGFVGSRPPAQPASPQGFLGWRIGALGKLLSHRDGDQAWK